MDISKAIDRAAGAEREVIGRATKARSTSGNSALPTMGGEVVYRTRDITAPATDAARDWEGWGTQLKPAVEPILVFQKPIAERTIAANVLTHGTGGLNIDACRVASGEDTRRNSAGGENGMLGTSTFRIRERYADEQPMHAGRFPANLVLSHAPGCREVGTREITGDARDTGDRLGGARPSGFADVGSEAGDSTPSGRVYGAETVATWLCEPGCAVAELDAQSGTRRSGTRRSGTYRGIGYQGSDAHEYPEVIGDEGAASRFFFQARLDEHGRFKYSAKASTRERSLGLPEGQRNRHSTVKPVALMRWLVRLMTPPGGVVLDPFMGSGTTGVAARLEGFGFVGVERDEDSHATARGRIEAWREYEEKPKKPSGARKAKAPAPSPAPAAIESKAEAPSSAERRRSQLSLFGDAA
jgi:site-specific DNA-methyltransferase (adenine-specific)